MFEHGCEVRGAWRRLWLGVVVVFVGAMPVMAEVSVTGTFTPGVESFDEIEDGDHNVIGYSTPVLYLTAADLLIDDTDGATGLHKMTLDSVLWLASGSITIADHHANGVTARLTTNNVVDPGLVYPEVLLGYNQLPGDTATVDINGGRWDARTVDFKVGHGGNATVDVRNGGVLTRNIIDYGYEIELLVGSDASGDRGDGTLNVRDGGNVYGNVVVGAGGTGELNVYSGGTLGLGAGDHNDYLTVGSVDTVRAGTATFMTGSTCHNEYWNIGAGGRGTVNVQAGVTTRDSLHIRLLEGGGEGTLNLQSGVDMTVRNLRLNGGAGTGQVNLNNATLTVSNDMYSQGLLGGTTTVGLNNGSVLNTAGETFIGWGSAAVTVNLDNASQWNTDGDIELGNGGLCHVNIGAGSSWNANQSLVGDALANDVRTSAGDSSDTGGQTFITMTGHAVDGDANCTMYRNVVLSYWGSTTVTQNAHSNWRVMGVLAASTAATPSTTTTIHLNAGSTTQWDQGISKGGGTLEINLNGGDLTVGDPGNTTPSFQTEHLASFTGGSLRVTGDLAGSTPLPEVASGMAVRVDGATPVALLHNDATSGTGRVRTSTLVADYRTDGWLFSPSSADPADPGVYFDHFRIDGGKVEFNADIDLTDGVHEWTTFPASRVTAHGQLVMAKTVPFDSPVPTYELVERDLTLDGGGASADFTDAPTTVSPGFSFGSGAVVVKNHANWATAETRIVEGAAVMLESSGCWHARQGFVMESLFGLPGDPVTPAVTIAGGTLEYGTMGWTPAAAEAFNMNTKIAEFTSGTLIVHGPIAGDFELAPGATASGSDFAGNVIVGGVLMPGASPAASTMHMDFMVESTGTVEMELTGPAAGDDYDRVTVIGNVMLDGTLKIIIDKAYQPDLGDTFQLFQWDNYVGGTNGSGEFDMIMFDNAIYDGTFDYEVAGPGGETFGVLTITRVPEPGTIALIAAGAGVALWRRRAA